MSRRLRPVACVSLAAAALLVGGPAAAQDVAPAPAEPPPPSIAPPPPMDPNVPGADPNAAAAQQQATNEQLDRAEREDSGRNFELFWVDGMLGGSYIDMRQFSASSLQLEKASAEGPMFSLGAGLRLVVFVIGVRAKLNALSAFNMWQVNGEVGFKIPMSKVDFLIGAHGGYSFVGALGSGTVAASSASVPAATDEVRIRGFNAGLDLALDYYVTPVFSIGAGVFGDFLLLNRPPVPIPAGLTPEQAAVVQQDPLYQQSGTSAGLQLGGALRLGFHFAL